MSDKPKKFFCTFADSRLWRSLARIKGQAERLGVYDEVLVYNEADLPAGFRKRFGDKLVPGCRGLGYWVWKPQIILQTFESMKDGDLLHYCDAGSWLNPKGAGRLLEYFTLAEAGGILAFQAKNTFGDPHLDKFSLPEYKWTKGDLFDYFAARDNTDLTNSAQIGATTFLLKKSERSRDFVARWLGVYKDNISLADDTPSVSANFNGFVENRYDQSIFSILCKLSKVKTLSAFEYWYPSEKDITKPDWSKLAAYPIWAKRDKDLGPIWMWPDLFRRRVSGLKRRILKLRNWW